MDHYEREFARGLVNYLSDAIRVAATNAGARYVDVSDAFIEDERDYRLCGNQANLAVNGLVIRGTTNKKPGKPEYQESYHPNLLGHALLASEINEETQSLTQGVPLRLPIAPVAKQDENLRRAFVGDTEQLINIKKPGYDSNLVQGAVTRGESLEYESSSDWPAVGSEGKAVIELHSTPIKLGKALFDAEGKLAGSVVIPTDVEPGYHELHVKYDDFFGESVDRYQIVFVRASNYDYDGDGVPNDTDPCVISTQSRVDNDEDGIDDACDNEYVKQASTSDGELVESEEVTKIVESIAVLAVQPQPTSTGEVESDSVNSADTEQMTTDGQVLSEDTEMLTFGTDSSAGKARKEPLNLIELLIVVGVLAIISTATLVGSKLLGKRMS